MTPLLVYKKYFEFMPSPFQLDLMQQSVTDLERWDATCLYWAGNSYRPQSILKMIGYYDDLVTGKQVNGKPRSAWQEVGRNHVPDDPNFVFDPASLICDVCGKECCLDLHRDEGVNVI